MRRSLVVYALFILYLDSRTIQVGELTAPPVVASPTPFLHSSIYILYLISWQSYRMCTVLSQPRLNLRVSAHRVPPCPTSFWKFRPCLEPWTVENMSHFFYHRYFTVFIVIHLPSHEYMLTSFYVHHSESEGWFLRQLLVHHLEVSKGHTHVWRKATLEISDQLGRICRKWETIYIGGQFKCETMMSVIKNYMLYV